MSSTVNNETLPTTPSSPAGHGLAVRPVDIENTIPVDGPVFEVNTSSCDFATSTSEDDLSTEVEVAALQSPFESPKSCRSDGMSDTSVESGAIPESIVGDCYAVEREALGGGQEDVAKVSEEEGNRTKSELQSESGIIEPQTSADETVTEHQKIADTVTTSTTPAHSDHVVVPDGFTVVESAIDTDHVPKDSQEVAHLRKTEIEVGEDAVFNDGEETVTKGTEQIEPALSVPPHLRTGLQLPTTRPCSLQDSKYSTAIPMFPRHSDKLRALRSQYTHGTHRNYDGREELARMSAQLMKVRNELDAERKKSTSMRKSIEDEKEKVMDAALASMTTELLNKQFKTLTQQGKVEAMERDLLFRQARIEKLEVFLSEGQKQVYRQSHTDEEEGAENLNMAEVNREHDRRQTELKAQKEIADREGKLAICLQGLRLLEAAQEMREQQYKTLIRGAVESETREKAMPNMDIKLNEIAGIEYNRGFCAGKAIGRAGVKETREQGFIEGYAACRRAEVTLSKMRQGHIDRDSQELDFLYNPAHPHNIFTMGTKVGGMSSDKGKKPLVNNAEAMQDRGDKKPLPEQRKVEEPVRKLPPARPTFAAELRGPQNMHNGQHVLANGSASPTSAPAPNVNGTNGVYEGRRVVEYEEVAADSLIDLY